MNENLITDIFFVFFMTIYFILQLYVLIKNYSNKNIIIYALNKLAISIFIFAYVGYIRNFITLYFYIYLIIFTIYIVSLIIINKKNLIIELCLLGDIIIFYILFFVLSYILMSLGYMHC